jgi:7,8-dihydropterin-6-yl-methyl-4-(beta-D-ribofuranosyl)aminobenzene 5'-phosphate synthase
VKRAAIGWLFLAALAFSQGVYVGPDRAHLNNELGEPATGARKPKSEVEIRIVYDNTSADPAFPEDWGFAALVSFRNRRILFDSGTKPDLFLQNLRQWKIKPASLHAAVISHQHPDHRNGIYKLFPLHGKLPVYFLDNFEQAAFDQAAAVGLRPVRVDGPSEILPGVFTTGPVEGEPFEQALVIETSDGPVMLVGCSHPGIVRLVETVQQQRGHQHIRLLLGGFHMFQQDEPQIRRQVQALQRLNVQRIVPAHCTGDLARSVIGEIFGSAYETAGAGKLLVLPLIGR